MPIEVRITGTDEIRRFGKHYSRAREIFSASLEKSAKVFGFEAQRISKKEYLSGPRPEKLQPVTGRLRSSITSDVSRDGNSIKIAVGTNVVYAPAHEFGFHGRITVPAHDRVVTKVFGRSVDAVTQHVRSYSRMVNLRQRPFLAPAVQDALPAFEDRIATLLRLVGIGEEPRGGE